MPLCKSGVLLSGLALMMTSQDGPLEAEVRTIGLVLASWRPALYETADGREECPDGFQADSVRDNWKAIYPDPAEQERQLARIADRSNRAADGVNVAYFPWLAQDALPLREARSKVAPGLNLDGRTDGAATAVSCATEPFISADGVPGIDNQFYRLSGCSKGWRKGGLLTDFPETEIVKSSRRLLIEITHVDDEQNDPEVQIAIYKGRGKLAQDANGKVIVGQSSLIDERFPQFTARTRGRIVNGVLHSEPVDVSMAMTMFNVTGTLDFQRMQLQLQLAGNGATGLYAGYMDIERWWNLFSRATAGLDYIANFSQPATYRGLYRLADANKDPVTGECRAISANFNTVWTRVKIIHPVQRAVASADEGGIR